MRPLGDRELAVERTDAPDDDQGRREVAAHLLVWELLHPESPGEIVSSGPPERPCRRLLRS